MDTKRSITTKSGKIIELEEQEHTPEINEMFPRKPETTTIIFDEGIEVTVPKQEPTERRAWYQQASELNGFWSNVKGYMARYQQGGDALSFVHNVVGTIHDLPVDSDKNEVMRKVNEAVRSHARKRVETVLLNMGLTANAAGFKTATGYSDLEAMLNDGNYFSDVLETIAKYERPDTTPKEQPLMNRTSQAPTMPTRRYSGLTTFAGVAVEDIPERMNAHLPPQAYEEIPYGAMQGKTDIGFDYIRDRFDEVFGVIGIGWKIEPHDTMGGINHTTTEKMSNKNRAYTEHTVTMVNHVFKYRIQNSDGWNEWVNIGTLTDGGAMEDEGYAYRGAFTSLLKQVFRMFGGLNHVYRGEYTHIQAKRDLAQRK